MMMASFHSCSTLPSTSNIYDGVVEPTQFGIIIEEELQQLDRQPIRAVCLSVLCLELCCQQKNMIYEWSVV